MKLVCKECGAVVEQPESRQCGHNTSGVVAELSATCYGEGGASEQNWLEKLILKVIVSLKKK